MNKKSKAANVKPFMVKNHLWVFINTQIENPAFDSQVCGGVAGLLVGREFGWGCCVWGEHTQGRVVSCLP